MNLRKVSHNYHNTPEKLGIGVVFDRKPKPNSLSSIDLGDLRDVYLDVTLDDGTTSGETYTIINITTGSQNVTTGHEAIFSTTSEPTSEWRINE